MTTAARVPFLPSSSMIGGTVSGGVAMTASSGAAGSDVTDLKHSCPAIAA